jgi:hypothetical protein
MTSTDSKTLPCTSCGAMLTYEAWQSPVTPMCAGCVSLQFAQSEIAVSPTRVIPPYAVRRPRPWSVPIGPPSLDRFGFTEYPRS